jgi:hypothetical protein
MKEKQSTPCSVASKRASRSCAVVTVGRLTINATLIRIGESIMFAR